jgi:DNA replication protein DnaC
MNKRDNTVVHSPDILPSNYDYYSITSSFQHMAIARQMELQNTILNFIKSRFGIQNAMINMVVLLLIMNPSKVYDLFLQYSFKYIDTLQWGRQSIVAYWNRQPVPQLVKVEINYIHENTINHLYVAMDWYLKSNTSVVSDHNHILGILKEPIVPCDNGTSINAIQKSYPQQTVTEFKYKHKTIHYSRSDHDTTIYSPSGEIKKKNYQILLWSTDSDRDHLEKMCIEVANHYSKSKVDKVWKQKMFTNDGSKWKEQSLMMNKRKVSTVIMNDNINLKIMGSVRHFIDTEEWHLERGINYKLGFLFYGPPGTGKTSLIKAISHEIQRHIHFLNLNTVKTDHDLDILMSTIDFKETIVVLEDIDAMGHVVHDRELLKEVEVDEKQQVQPVQQLTLSALLNQLDGIKQTHGMILIMTSNHPEVLDAALIRDGRVDEKVLFDYCTPEQTYLMFVNFYNGKSPDRETIMQVLEQLDNIAPSTVESSMRKYYKDPIQALDYLVKGRLNNGLDIRYKTTRN